MAGSRRELLAGLGAGLVALQGTAFARGEGVRVGERLASMGDIEDLRREIRDNNQRLQNALARIRRTGFGPSPLLFTKGGVNTAGEALNGVVNFLSLPFPGSVVALSVTGSAPSGTPGSDYWTMVVEKDGVATAASVILDAGSTSGEAVFGKGEVTFEPGDRISVTTGEVGSPGSTGPVAVLVWVSFT